MKIADTEKEKNAKRIQGALASLGGINGLGVSPLGLSPLQAAAYYQVLSVSFCDFIKG